MNIITILLGVLIAAGVWALVELAVAHHVEDAVVPAVALAGEGHAHGAGGTLAERAGGNVDAGALQHARVALKHGALLPERVQYLLREVSELAESGILDGADMSLGENKAVAVRPLGILGIHAHFRVVERSDYVRRGKGAAGMAGLRLVYHRQRGLSQLLGPLFQLVYLLIWHRKFPLSPLAATAATDCLIIIKRPMLNVGCCEINLNIRPANCQADVLQVNSICATFTNYKNLSSNNNYTAGPHPHRSRAFSQGRPEPCGES